MNQPLNFSSVKNVNISGVITDKMFFSFQKPRYKELAHKGYMCIDMHYQTTHSTGGATIAQTLKKMRKLGIGVAITDHDTISGVEEAFAIKKKEDIVIPGIEVRSNEYVDLIFYFYDLKEAQKFYRNEIKGHRKVIKNYVVAQKTKVKRSLKDLVVLNKKYKCLIAAPHPFGYWKKEFLKVDIFDAYVKYMEKIDIFEAINGSNIKRRNQKAIDYIVKHKKQFTGGSDAHAIFDLGKVVTCAKVSTTKDFLDSIKKRQNIVVGTGGHNKLLHYVKYGLNKAMPFLM